MPCFEISFCLESATEWGVLGLMRTTSFLRLGRWIEFGAPVTACDRYTGFCGAAMGVCASSGT